jgi:hypothetical protein
MKGQPIPGKHWVQIDNFPNHATCIAHKFLIDWETAFGSEYEILGLNRNNEWVTLYSTRAGSKETKVSKAKQHVIHEFDAHHEHEITSVKLSIIKAGTQWGVSVWRFQVWGVCGG